MARKSRKHLQPKFTSAYRNIVGYIRLSVKEKDHQNSLENQKLLIEDWAQEHHVLISHYYIDNGFSGKRFDRPAFSQLFRDVQAGKVACIVAKDLSRLGRDYIAVGNYLERVFPAACVRFVSIDDKFDTIDGITDQNCSYHTWIRVPVINLFNEQVSLETKIKIEGVLDMKAKEGKFIGPKAPFGYQKSKEDHGRLIPDPDAAPIVQKIFDLFANDTGLNAIVRYLNQNGIPTPIQYARSKGLKGNYVDGNGSWNSRSVKNILTNRTYMGTLVQGKERRTVAGTHEPLVDADTFNAIQTVFKSTALADIPKTPSADNILKGKVICACCGGKMQRRRGAHHADWFFFSCITKNRLGEDKCSGMYVREDDIFHAIYNHLKTYVKENYISDFQHQTRTRELDEQIARYSQQSDQAWNSIKQNYEAFVQGTLVPEKLREIMEAANRTKMLYREAVETKERYEKKYNMFQKLLAASDRMIPIREIMDWVDEVRVDTDKRIVVKLGGAILEKANP